MGQKQSFRTKLFVCFGVVLLAATAGSVYCLYTMRNLESQLRTEIVGSSLRLDQSRQITIGVASMRMAMRGVSLFAMMHQAAPLAKARSAFEASAAQMREVIQQMSASQLTAQDATAVSTIRVKRWMASTPPARRYPRS
jgi:hypothetical protein